MSRASLRNVAAGWLLGIMGVGALGTSATADVIVLRGGGQVRGKVVPIPDSKEERVEVILPRSRSPLILRREQIGEVVPEPSPLDEYVERREKVEPTAEAEFALGRWCEENDLPDLAPIHYETALEYDEEFEAAHLKLGHVERDGQWHTRDALREAGGLVLWKGRWLSEDDQERELEDERAAEEHTSWVQKIRAWDRDLRSNVPERRNAAEIELGRIDDPAAVPALLKVLGASTIDSRLVLAQVLGGIPGASAARALVDMILAADRDSVRLAALDQLKKRDEPGIAARLVKALRSRNLELVNRAAWALGNLDVAAAVPSLLKVLVTTEERVVLVPTDGYEAAGAAPGPRYPPILMAWNGVNAAFLTPPVVAPGAVAYGAYVVPGVFGFNPYNGAPLSIGGLATGGYQPSRTPIVGADRGPAPQLRTFTYQNVEVHDALVKLTGQDFGYDVAQWRTWVARAFNPQPEPIRRIPQP